MTVDKKSVLEGLVIPQKLLLFILTTKGDELSKDPALTEIVVSLNHMPISSTSCRKAGGQSHSSKALTLPLMRRFTFAVKDGWKLNPMTGCTAFPRHRRRTVVVAPAAAAVVVVAVAVVVAG